MILTFDQINSFLSTTFSGIRTSIQNDVNSANSAISSAISAINKVNPFGNINVPQLSVPSLDALQNVTLPTDFEDALNKLNASLPTVSDLKDKVNALYVLYSSNPLLCLCLHCSLDTPFEALKADINNTFSGLSFDSTVLPIPEQNTLSFCGQLDTSVVDDLGRDLLKATKIGIVILIFLALLLLAGNCALEWYKWRCMKFHLENTRQAWMSDPTIYHTGPARSTPSMTLTDHNLMMLHANSTHPLLTRIAYAISRRFRMSPSQHTHLQWFFHYVFHPPALACFLIGFFGLLSVQLQLIAIGPLESKYQAQAASSAADFSNTIATSINGSMYNQSSFYANDVNGRVDTIQNTINNGVFGWVNGTTTTLNNTLNEFYDDIQNAVSTVFNGTILESPAQEFVKCFLGSKIDALEDALTFLHNNLNVQIPRVNDSILVLSPADVNEATQPIAVAAIGGQNSDGSNNQGLVGRLVNTYVNSLKKERVMFAIFMGLWGLVVLMALVIIFWHSYGQYWVEARKKRRWQREQRGGIENIPYHSGDNATSVEDSGIENGSEVDLRSFTPMPEHKSAGSRFNISKPKKLMAIGRKAMGNERFVGDSEEGSIRSSDESDGDKESLAWLKRMKGSLFNKNRPQPTMEDDVRTRMRPSLTVSVDSVAALKSNGGVEKSPRKSHWSTSPSPKAVAPWKLKRIPSPPGLPSRPFPKRNASVPNDVQSIYDDSTLLIPKDAQTKPTPLAVPLHHGFDRPIPLETPHSPSISMVSPFDSPIYQTPVPPLHPQSRTGLAPPRNRHRRSSSVPAAVFKYAGHRDLTSSHNTVKSPPRQSVVAVPVNPFATPFDDDANVRNRDSFAAVAL